MNLDLRLVELLPHPVEAVWAALTDPDAISDWLMLTTDFRPELGVEFRMRTQHQSANGGWVEAKVLELDPPRRMAWAWGVGDDPPTTVTFELVAEGAGTRLELTHVGEIDSSLGARFRDGWPGRIELLQAVLKRRNDDD
jgi:uncharacterized protein YndB with AHSA1/START domain